MRSALFDKETSPADYQRFHFKIRGWKVEGSPGKFDEFIRAVLQDQRVSTRKVTLRANNVAYIQLTTASTSSKNNAQFIDDLCWAIVNPRNRRRVNDLTSRSLLGFSPLGAMTEAAWRDAVFRTALREGPGFLKGITKAGADYIPFWALTLVLSVMSEINMGGYQLTSSMSTADSSIARDENISDKINVLFGPKGVLAAANFLETLRPRIPSQPMPRGVYDNRLREVETKIDAAIRTLENLREKRQDSLSECCRKAMAECYSAAVCAAKMMLEDKEVFEAYLEACKKDLMSSPTGAAGAAFLTTAAASLGLTSAPLSLSSLAAFATTGSWPMVVTVVSPVTFTVGVVGLGILALSNLSSGGVGDRVLRHQKLVILTQRCCAVINTANLLLRCIYYLSSSHGRREAVTFINAVGYGTLAEDWEAFAREDNERRVTKSRNKAYAKGRGASWHWFCCVSQPKAPRHRGDLNKRQRQVHRFMKKMAAEEGQGLSRSLQSLRVTGELDSSSDSASDNDE